MKKNAILINIARGPIVKTEDIIDALKTKTIAGYCADVYEYERDWYWEDHS